MECWSVHEFCLASSSPQRKNILDYLDIKYIIVEPRINEGVEGSESPTEYVVRLAMEKSKIGHQLCVDNQVHLPAVGADTCVVIGGEILPKPENAARAVQYLELLSGATHKVHTAVAITRGAQCEYELVTSRVRFARLSTKQIQGYIATDEWRNRAGAYAIQGVAAAFVSHLSGSYSNVVGLPLNDTIELLRNAGVSVPDHNKVVPVQQLETLDEKHWNGNFFF